MASQGQSFPGEHLKFGFKEGQQGITKAAFKQLELIMFNRVTNLESFVQDLEQRCIFLEKRCNMVDGGGASTLKSTITLTEEPPSISKHPFHNTEKINCKYNKKCKSQTCDFIHNVPQWKYDPCGKCNGYNAVKSDGQYNCSNTGCKHVFKTKSCKYQNTCHSHKCQRDHDLESTHAPCTKCGGTIGKRFNSQWQCIKNNCNNNQIVEK